MRPTRLPLPLPGPLIALACCVSLAALRLPAAGAPEPAPGEKPPAPGTGAAAAGAPAPDFATEIRLAADRSKVDVRKLRPADLKSIESVVRARLGLTEQTGGSVTARSFEEIVARVPTAKVEPGALAALARPGLLELRHLEDIQTIGNTRARYMLDILTVRGGRDEQVRVRFKDRESGRIIPAAEFVRRCPVVVTNAEVETALRIPGSLTGVRVRFNKAATRRLDRFAAKPGRLLAVVLDGELLTINAALTPSRAAAREKSSREKKMPAPGDKPAGEPGPAEGELAEVDVLGACESEEEAAQLAMVLRAPPLPCALVVLSSRLIAE